MFVIENLKASAEETAILQGINLKAQPGEVHVIMGKNGSGKSTLAQVLAGSSTYDVSEGSVSLEGVDLIDLDPEDRVKNGLFVGFQYPMEIPGVRNIDLFYASHCCLAKHHEREPLAKDLFRKKVDALAEGLSLDPSFCDRGVNDAFSGGEKKKNEILQMQLIDPKVAILDETDSGLDIDALKRISATINSLRRKDNTFIIITHYERFIDRIVPDFVHVMKEGKIVKQGSIELAQEIAEKGYDVF